MGPIYRCSRLSKDNSGRLAEQLVSILAVPILTTRFCRVKSTICIDEVGAKRPFETCANSRILFKLILNMKRK